MSPTPGSVIAGKFRLERPLAQGGMGSVWVAHNLQLDVPVALKFMAQAFAGSADLVARFEREAKAAAQLRHPNVVQVFEHGVAGGLPYIAMELLEGESLGQRLKARRVLSIGETSRILGDVCLALRRAHERDLVHRDLKPANIFLCRHDDLETVKVLDFGIVKSLSPSAAEEITKSGAIFGSPHYMSPEQARRTNRQVDHRTDLWALGVIAFRCLTGALPFPGDDTIDVLVRMCTDAAPLASSIAPALGPEVDRFFLRALARDPDDRFQSAKQLADALAALAALAAQAQPTRASIPALESRGAAAPAPHHPPLAAPAPPAASYSNPPAAPYSPAPAAPRSSTPAAPYSPAPAAPRSPTPQHPPLAAHAGVSSGTTTLPLGAPHAQPVLGSAPKTPGTSYTASGQAPSYTAARQATDVSRSVAQALTQVEPTAPGTLTGAGTALGSAGGATRPKGWAIPVVVGAALALGLAVIAIVAGSGAGAETSADSAHSTGSVAAGSPASDTPAANTASILTVTPGQAPTADSAAGAAVPTEPTTSAASPAASTAGAATPAAAAPRATSTPAAAKSTAAAATSPLPKTTGTAATPPAATSTAPAASATGGSGYLGKPRF